MEKEKRFLIGEIARFFELPASTLRYWDDCGLLLPEKDAQNRYRTYTLPDLMTISDILFYKSLGLSLEEIRRMEKAAPAQQEQVLHKNMETLLAQQEALNRRIEKMQNHLCALNTLEALQKTPFHVTDIDTSCIVSFALVEKHKLRRYIENPYLYSRVQHSDDLEKEQRGLTIPPEQAADFPPEQILWRKKTDRYVTFLMKEEICPGFPNDLAQKLAQVQRNGRTGSVISRFLLCGTENGKTYDFYKTYVELL